MPGNTGTPMLNNSTRSTSNSSDASVITIIGGAVGGIILLLMIAILLCVVILCVRRSHRKEELHVYDQRLYNETIQNTGAAINNNPSYDVTNTNIVDILYKPRDSNINSPCYNVSHSATNEEENNYEYNTNQSYGICTVENRAKVFCKTVMNSDMQDHQPSDSSHDHNHYDYIDDNVAQLHHNKVTAATNDVEDKVQVNTTIDQSYSAKTAPLLITASKIQLPREVEYGVINQPQCDDYDYDVTSDHGHDVKSIQLLKLPHVAGPNGECEYGVINQPRCDDPIIIDQDHIMTSCLPTLPLNASPSDEDEYGVINQPQSDGYTINTAHGITVCPQPDAISSWV